MESRFRVTSYWGINIYNAEELVVLVIELRAKGIVHCCDIISLDLVDYEERLILLDVIYLYEQFRLNRADVELILIEVVVICSDLYEIILDCLLNVSI